MAKFFSKIRVSKDKGKPQKLNFVSEYGSSVYLSKILQINPWMQLSLPNIVYVNLSVKLTTGNIS